VPGLQESHYPLLWGGEGHYSGCECLHLGFARTSAVAGAQATLGSRHGYRLAVNPPSDSPESSFADLGIRPELLATLTALGYEEPTPIQSAAIPMLIEGKDLLGQAATGTGKTASFALPILEKLSGGDRGKAPTSLVLVPTRELAIQVSQAFHEYGREVGTRLVAIYGGAPARQQIDALRRGVDVVVATPGRALDLCSRGSLVLDSIRTLVLDEADEMLEMGFIEDIESIIALTPKSRQTVLFSATMPKRIDKLAERHLRDPQRISIKSREPSSDEIPRVRQVAYVVTRQNKAAALGRLLDAEDPTAAIVFCRTRGGVDDLTDILTARGYQAEALHGGLTQDQRTRVLGRLRSGATELLVATDVAARGLDIDVLSHVVNFDLPMSPESYVHRIGRVGRAGREGVALSLVEPRERRMLASIEKLVGGRIRVEQVPTITDVRQVRQQRTRDAVMTLVDDPDAQARMDANREIVDEMLISSDPYALALAAFTLAHEELQGSAVDEAEHDLSAKMAPASTSGSKTSSKGTSKFSSKTGSKSSTTTSTKKREAPTGPMTRIFIALGRKAGVTPGDLVGAITGEAGLKGRDIGSISVHEMFSIAEVPSEKARKVIKSLQHTKIRGRKVNARFERD
jgi:ATP-dependent RNA helicase DeaD